MGTKISFRILVIGLLISPPAFAEVVQRDGTFSANFLRLPTNATVLAMQQADSDWLNPLTMVSINPARLIRLKGITGQFSYANMFDLIDFHNLSFGYRINKKNALGANIFYLNTRIPLTDERGAGLDTFNYTDIATEIVYAYRFLPTAAFGLSTKFLLENIYQQTSNGLAVSAGLYTDLGPDNGYLSFAVRNAGFMFNQSSSLPLDLYLNWTKSVSYLSLSLAINEKIEQINSRLPDAVAALIFRPIEIIDGYFSCRYSQENSSFNEAWASGIKIKIHSLNINYGFSPHSLGARQIVTLSWIW